MCFYKNRWFAIDLRWVAKQWNTRVDLQIWVQSKSGQLHANWWVGGQMKCLVWDWKPWVNRKFEHHYLKSSKRTNCLLIFYFISTSQVYFWSKLIKGPPQPLSCFCLHLGTRRTKLLEISTKRYLITKRNSKVHCRMVYELRKQPMAWMETDYSKHTHLDGR